MNNSVISLFYSVLFDLPLFLNPQGAIVQRTALPDTGRDILLLKYLDDICDIFISFVYSIVYLFIY